MSSIASSALERVASSGEYSSGNYNVDGSCEVRNFGMDHNGLMKAGTLVAGAITGGAAAALSKGYFWEGAVTGLFVAAFNDLAHNDSYSKQKSRLDKEVDKKYGIQADKPAPVNNNSVSEVSQLPLLKSVIANSGNQPFTVDPDNMYWPVDGDSEAITLIRSDLKNSDITYFKSSFSTYRSLAQHVLHENYHAYFNFKGYYAGLLSNGYSEHASVKISEYYVYSVCKIYAGMPLYVDYYRGQAYIQGQPKSHFPFLKFKH